MPHRYLVPDDPNVPYDMLSVVKKVVDEHAVFEIMPEFAKNIICGFARMEGRTVGVSDNNITSDLNTCLILFYSPV